MVNPPAGDLFPVRIRRSPMNLCHSVELTMETKTAEAKMTGLIPSLALVVEDHPLQREFLRDLLRSENLDVIQCESAEAAELIVARSGPELTLLVTDAALAGRGTGMELAQFAKRQFPGLNVILVSGQDGLTPPAGVSFFRKPFAPAELLRAAMSGASLKLEVRSPVWGAYGGLGRSRAGHALHRSPTDQQAPDRGVPRRRNCA